MTGRRRGARVVDAGVDQGEFDLLGVFGLELEVNVAMLRRPSGRRAPYQDRLPAGKLNHPLHGRLPLGAKRDWLRGLPEESVVIMQRLLDLVVAGEGRALGQAELAAGFALCGSPVGKTVLGDESRGRLRDLRSRCAPSPKSRAGATELLEKLVADFAR